MSSLPDVTKPWLESPCEVITKERKDVVTLMAMGFYPIRIEQFIIPGREIPLSFFTFPVDAFETWKNFKLGKAMAIENVQLFWTADTTFNQLVHGDRQVAQPVEK